jgi:predicted nucleic acid-binding protein
VPFVLDASVALSWCFEDEADADRWLDALDGDSALTPPVWPLEIGNALLAGERRGRLTAADTFRLVELFRSLPIVVQPDQAPSDRALGPVLDIARERGLTSYDASYLELAMREGVPLATLDQALGRAAAGLGVPLSSEGMS